jgi:hypothetical protein
MVPLVVMELLDFFIFLLAVMMVAVILALFDIYVDVKMEMTNDVYSYN